MSQPAREIEPIFFELLGRIITRWAFAETLLNEFLAFLLKADHGLTYVVTSNVSGSTVADWIRTIFKIYAAGDEAAITTINDLLNQIDDVRGQRNRLAHGVWATHASGPGTVAVQTINWQRTEIVKIELVTTADLNDLLDEIGEIIGKLRALGTTLGFLNRPN